MTRLCVTKMSHPEHVAMMHDDVSSRTMTCALPNVRLYFEGTYVRTIPLWRFETYVNASNQTMRRTFGGAQDLWVRGLFNKTVSTRRAPLTIST